MIALFKLLSAWPLWLLHGMGCGAGLAGFSGFAAPTASAFWPMHGRRVWAGSSGWARWGRAGKLVAELPRLWLGRPVPCRVGWRRAGRGSAGAGTRRGVSDPASGLLRNYRPGLCRSALASAQPMTVLFRPPRQAWLRELVMASRAAAGLADGTRPRWRGQADDQGAQKGRVGGLAARPGAAAGHGRDGRRSLAARPTP